MIWKFINTGFNTGKFNMAFDEDLAKSLKEAGLQPTLRVYGWEPTAISIGFNQSMEDFDLEKLRHDGIDIVRRPTGGRAIYHATELTYSVVMMLDDKGPREIYRFINEGLLTGLRYLGIMAELSGSEPDFREIYRDAASIPCFSNSAKNEIHYGGKKLVGSAQRRYGKSILQHGSILMGPEHRKIVEYISERGSEISATVEKELTYKTTDIKTILGTSVDFEEIAEAVVQGFSDRHGITFEEIETDINRMEE